MFGTSGAKHNLPRPEHAEVQGGDGASDIVAERALSTRLLARVPYAHWRVNPRQRVAACGAARRWQHTSRGIG